MSHDEKSWEDFNKVNNEESLMLSALYSSYLYKSKPSGSNYTPPKKKRKKRK